MAHEPGGARVRGTTGRAPLGAELPSNPLETVPWPALLVTASGAVLAVSPAAAALLGMTPTNIAAIEDRFEALTASGQPVEEDHRPLHRAARAEIFEAVGRWRDRDGGRELSLRFRGRAAGRDGLLELDLLADEAQRRAEAKLGKLNDALLERTPAQGGLSIHELLRQLVSVACEMTGARYGAIGVLAPDGASLEDFVAVGVPEDAARAMGRLPRGKGLLGAVIREAATVRVPDVARDPRSCGFPPGHPQMTSFLGVPLRLGHRVFGNFYLGDKRGGAAFTEEDARLVERFGAQAALTVAYARQARREERRLFDVLMHHAPHGIVYFPADPAGEVLGNPAAERMLGRLTRGNGPARTYELKHPDGTPFADEELPSTRALRLEAVTNAEVIIERRGGPAIPALASASPVVSESGAELGAVVIFQDITALKRLRRLSRDFLALVAHELRVPLQSILMQLELLLRRSAGGVPARVPHPTLEAMKRSARQLERLVRDLVEASRIDAHGIAVDLSTVRLPELVSSVVSRIEGVLPNHALEVEVVGNPPPVKADPRRVEQILTNLVENASKYSAERAPIRVVVADHDAVVTMSVVDQGPGVPAEELPKLFDPWFQAQNVPKGRGLGLGLFITKGLVEAQGGTIEVESAAGVGTTFRVSLTAAPRSGAARDRAR